MHEHPGHCGFLDPRTAYSSKNWLVTRILENMIRAHAPMASGRLLDIGCGNKTYEKHFAPYVSNYIGLEFPATRADRQGDVYGTALSLPFAGKAFDTVVSFQVLEHVPDPQTAVNESYRVLKRGGKILLTTNFMWGIHEEPHDYFRFTRYALTLLFDKAGFEQVSVVPMAGFWVTAGQRISYALERHLQSAWAALRIPVLFAIQYCAGKLDRIDRWEDDPWNYLVIATKPSKCGGGAK
jgi:SAM-dependent methyltransferase